MPMADRLPAELRIFITITLIIFFSAAPLISQTQRNAAVEAYEAGQDLFRSDFVLEAIRSYQDAIGINPNFADSYREIARCFYYLDEYDEAEAYILQALSRAPSDSESRTLYGRILITRGRIDEAEAVFRDVLADEPFNTGARIGLGELSLARGDVISAGEFYEGSLGLDPGDRRVLLALAFIARERGQQSAAREYILRALEADSQNAWVQYYAADFYYGAGDYDLARFHALIALELRQDFYPASELLSRVLVSRGEYSEAIAIMDQMDFTRIRDPRLLYYTKAMAEYQSGDAESALLTLDRALREYPEEEISRLLLEEIVLFLYELDLEHPIRSRFAEYHLIQAEAFMQRNRFSAATYHLQRGLTLAPFSEEGRRLNAELLRESGDYSRYVRALEFLTTQLGASDQSTLDDLEIYADILRDSVPRRWDIDQFLLERNLIDVGVYLIEGSSATIHGGAERVVGRHLMDRLYVSNTLRLIVPPGVDELSYDIISVSSEARAFEHARRNGAEYYLVFTMGEGQENIELNARLHLGRTGRPLRSFSVIRSGVGRMRDAVTELSDQIIDSLPLRGTLVRRNFERGLINIGLADGISEGDELLLLKSGDLRLYTEDSRYDYDDDDIIGRAMISGIDYLVSEVLLEHEGFFDRITRGDLVIPAPPAELADQAAEPVDPPVEENTGGFLALANDLYDLIRQIR
jgi:tetratricopeptide (TPR) repeat protein